MTAALEIEGLTKAYGALKAVDGLSFVVPKGSLTAFIGPNGAGKSTTMRCIAGLQIADRGAIRIGGEDVAGNPLAAKSRCGLTPQELAMFEYLTGEETLRFVGELRGMTPDAIEADIAHWMELTELGGARGRLVREFSGGMKRKLAIASAMLGRPPVVLLDESFTGLDPESTYALRAELRAYCDAGGAVLLSSHILDMVQAIADHVVIIHRGVHVETLDRAGLDALVPSEFASLTELYLQRVGKLRS